MPTTESRQILGSVRAEIVTRLDALGRPEWPVRFGESFTAANIQATLDEIMTLREETETANPGTWDVEWRQAQEDVWSGLRTAGLTNEMLTTVRVDSDVRAVTVLKAMIVCASLLVMRDRGGG